MCLRRNSVWVRWSQQAFALSRCLCLPIKSHLYLPLQNNPGKHPWNFGFTTQCRLLSQIFSLLWQSSERKQFKVGEFILSSGFEGKSSWAGIIRWVAAGFQLRLPLFSLFFSLWTVTLKRYSQYSEFFSHPLHHLGTRIHTLIGKCAQQFKIHLAWWCIWSIPLIHFMTYFPVSFSFKCSSWNL